MVINNLHDDDHSGAKNKLLSEPLPSNNPTPNSYYANTSDPYLHQQSNSLENVNLHHVDSEEKICRCCHGVLTANDDYISPCKCSGSMKFVHRYCLDQWRAVSPKQSSFYQCDICSHSYDIKDVDENGRVLDGTEVQQGGCCGYKPKTMIKFGTLVTIDFGIILLVWQVLVLACAGFFALCDYDYGLRAKLFGVEMNIYLVTYICGLVMFFFFLGLMGLCCSGIVLVNKMMNGTWFGNCCTTDEFYSYDTYPYYARPYSRYACSDMFFWYCFWSSLYGRPYNGGGSCCYLGCLSCGNGYGGGDCGNCDLGGSCSGDCKGEGVLIIILVIVLAVAIVGLLFGVILMVLLGYRIFSRRFTVLKRKDESKYQQIQNYWPIEH